MPIKEQQPASTGLARINDLITRAINSWNLTERVRRAALPSHLYDAADLRDYRFLLADADDGSLAGVAALTGPVEPGKALPEPLALLHGLYVEPALHRTGIGRALLKAAEAKAVESGFHCLLVRAHRDSQGFFETNGYRHTDRVSYPYAWVKELPAS
jgi:GNAT superfamily N-acetyltransferase